MDNINYDSDQIVNASNTTFLGLIIDNSLSWKGHMDWLMSKLGSACYATRAIKPYMAQGDIKNDLFFIFSFSYDIWFGFLG
jgi:hypothetical protein